MIEIFLFQSPDNNLGNLITKSLKNSLMVKQSPSSQLIK